MQLKIELIREELHEIEGVASTIIDASDKVWIHIVLEPDIASETVVRRIEDSFPYYIIIDSTYMVGSGFLSDARSVIKTRVS